MTYKGGTMAADHQQWQRAQLQQESSRAAEHVHEPRDLFRTVPLAKQVYNWTERMRAGVAIDVASSTLSMLTVVTYMVRLQL
jgi:hypothetical protein